MIKAFAVECDVIGKIYVTGKFYETVDFDLNTTHTLDGVSSGNIFAAKCSETAKLMWAKNIGGISSDAGNSIYIDGSNNTVTSDYFEDTADFNPGTGTDNLTATGSSSASAYASVLDVLRASVRFSFCKYTTKKEIDYTLEKLKRMLKYFFY